MDNPQAEIEIENAHADQGTTAINNNTVLNDRKFAFVCQGNIKQLQKYLELDKKKFGKVDTNGETVLHHAVRYNKGNLALQMVDNILRWKHFEALDEYDEDREKFVNIQNTEGKTALHLAAAKGRKAIIEKLLEGDAMVKIKDNDKKTPMEDIYKKFPEVIVTTYADCVTFDDDVHESLNLDFSPIIGYMEECDKETDDMKETNFIADLINVPAGKVSKVLRHPLLQVFLYKKYEKAFPIILASIVIHIIWYATYAYFIYNLYFESCPWLRNRGNETELREESMKVACAGRDFKETALPLAGISWAFSLIFLIKECFEVATVRWDRYFSQLENLGQLALIASVIWTPWPVYEYLAGKDVVIIKPWQFELAAASVFAVWALALSQLGKFHRVRLYLEIFIQLTVCKSFLFFALTFVSLLLAFAFAFCIIMPESKAFETPLLAFPKVLSMMTGEINYDDTFYNGEDDGPRSFHFTATQVTFTLFTIIMSIILINLLVGLTVSDTQKLKERGHIAQLSSMLEQIVLVESLAIRLYNISSSEWLLDNLAICPKRYDPKITLTISDKHSFPKNIMDELIEQAENYKEEESTDNENFDGEWDDSDEEDDATEDPEK